VSLWHALDTVWRRLWRWSPAPPVTREGVAAIRCKLCGEAVRDGQRACYDSQGNVAHLACPAGNDP